jgi:chromosome segregation ATPase
MDKLTTDDFLMKLKDSPIGQKLLEDVAREESERAERSKAIAELLELHRQRVSMMNRQIGEHDESVERIRRVQQEYDEARRAGNAIESRHHSERFVIDSRIGTLEAFLWQTAPAGLKEKLERIEKELAEVKSTPIVQIAMHEVEDPGKSWVETDYPARLASIKSLQGAIEAVKKEILTTV